MVESDGSDGYEEEVEEDFLTDVRCESGSSCWRGVVSLFWGLVLYL